MILKKARMSAKPSARSWGRNDAKAIVRVKMTERKNQSFHKPRAWNLMRSKASNDARRIARKIGK